MRTISMLALLLMAPAHAADSIELNPSAVYRTGTGQVQTAPWWVAFNDPQLTAVMENVLANNPDVARIQDLFHIQQGVELQTFSPLLPMASFEAGVNTGPYTASMCTSVASNTALANFDPAVLLTNPGAFGQVFAPDPNAPELCNTGSGLLVSSWGLDVFGRQTLAWRGSSYERQAAKGDAEATRLVMTTAAAAAYYDVVLANAQLTLLAGQVTAQEALLELVTLRYEAGGASGLDVLQQQQLLATTKAALPSVTAFRERRARQLTAMLGEVGAEPDVVGALPEPTSLPQTGVPVDLLANRPDIRAVDARMSGAAANRTSAQLGLLPSLRASGQAGWAGLWIDGDFNSGPAWGAGLNLSVPLFNGGALHGRIRTVRASESLAIHTYNSTVINAVAEVESALSLDEQQGIRHQAVLEQERAAKAAFDESKDRYLAGLDSYLSVLTAERAHQSAELAVLQAKRDAVGARIQLHDALGGAWVRDETLGGVR
ncbi:MAG: TolC family protein [Rhodobacterales bacterium]|nr:TolC family protein [Rhodobacterales bacterium]